MNTISKLLYFTFTLLITQSTIALGASPEPAFEGYYKVILGGQHAGYVAQRFVVEDKKKQVTSTYYLYVATPTGSTTESLVAVADLNFEPISFQYSAVVDGKAKANDGTFKAKKMTGKMIDAGKTQNVTANVPTNGFLSTFLNYVILKNGLMVGKSYEFIALAEEAPACFAKDPNCKPKEAGFIKGVAAIKSQQKVKGQDAFKVEFTYKGVSFTGLIAATGETLASISPAQDVSTELVSSKEEAVGAFAFNTKHITALFGGVPAGKKNSLFATPSVGPATSVPVANPIPVQIGGSAAPAPNEPMAAPAPSQDKAPKKGQ